MYILLSQTSAVLSDHQSNSNKCSLQHTCVHLHIACSTLIALAQPYKKPYMNYIDTLILGNNFPYIEPARCTTIRHIYYILLHKWQHINFSSIARINWSTYLQDNQESKTKLPYCKRLLHLHKQEGHNDTEDYDQLILESVSRELQENTVSVKEEHISVYKRIS